MEVTTTVETPVWGVRCTDPGHRRHYDVVYASSPSQAQMRSLTVGNPCNELVVSTDGGATWRLEASD